VIVIEEANKLATLTLNILSSSTPSCLLDLLIQFAGFSSSAYADLLTLPQMKLTVSSHVFHVSTPTVWNFIDNITRDSQTFSSFKRYLKTHLYRAAFNITNP